MEFHNRDKVVRAICKECGTGRFFPEKNFPTTGYWVECLVCEAYRMFYMLRHGRVVNTSFEGMKKL
jgi:hypothetical protein